MVAQGSNTGGGTYTSFSVSWRVLLYSGFFGFFFSKFHPCPIMGIMVDHQPHGVIICFVRNFTPDLLMFLVLLKSFSFPPRAHSTPFSEFFAFHVGSKKPAGFWAQELRPHSGRALPLFLHVLLRFGLRRILGGECDPCGRGP